MTEKSILEQALLQIETLEEAVKANAKGILASTMKQELNDLLKEQEDLDPEEDEEDVNGDDTPEDDDETSISDDLETDELDSESEFDEPELDDFGDEDEDEDILDMTNASEEEVLKVFKAMKPEDGIVVKKDGNTVQFSDDGNDYIIKLDDESDDFPSDEEDSGFPDNLSEQEEMDDEVVYEIELDEDEDEPFTQKVNTSKKRQANEQEGTKRPGTPVHGTGNPQTKEPGKGGVKTTHAEKFTGKAVSGTQNPTKKEPGKGGVKTTQAEKFTGKAVSGTQNPIKKEPKENMEQCDECGDKKIEATEAARTKWNPHGDKGAPYGQGRAGIKSKKLFKSGAGTLNEEVATLKKQNNEYKKALLLFKDKLNEVALFNANLAHATRLFTEHSTTKNEKLSILKRFDTISTISESRTLYKSIKNELSTSKPLTETVASKIASTPKTSSTNVLSESKAYENPQFKRMKELMNKIK